MKKKILSIVLTLCMVLSLMPAISVTASAVDTWDYPSSVPGTPFSSGSGTVGDPYEIDTPQELANLSFLIKSGNEAYSASTVYYKLTANIVLNDVIVDATSTTAKAWTPIGTFEGTFDGAGHTVSGIYINSSAQNIGLFGALFGTVKNVGVINSYIHGTYNNVGGVVGFVNKGTVSNCYNTGTVSSSSQYIGGVVGNANLSTITNCYNSGTINGVSGGSYVGGVVGTAADCTIRNCYNTGAVGGTGVRTGGVVGSNDGTSTSYNCYNTGLVSGDTKVGGVAGANIDNATMRNCYNTGTVIGGTEVGGVAGANFDDATMSNCYSTGSVIGGTEVGGVTGNNTSTVSNCYWLDSSATGGIGSGSGTNCDSFTGSGTTWALSSSAMGTTDLLTALNAWVTTEGSLGYLTWETGDGYPVFGAAYAPISCAVSASTNAVVANGVTATATFGSSPYVAGATATVTITLSGTAAAAGTHIVGLTSTKAGTITPPATVTRTVTAEETQSDTFSFTFAMPANAVDDLVVTHIFVTKNGNYIYANGNALILAAGSPTSTNTVIYIDTDRDGVIDSGEPIFSAGLTDGTNAGNDLSGCNIYGGTQFAALTGDTQITMLGGNVKRIVGGCESGGITGNTNIAISGGAVLEDIVGGSWSNDVNGNTNIAISGGTVYDVIGSGTNYEIIKGSTNIAITGGTVKGYVTGGFDNTGTGTKSITIKGGSVRGEVKNYSTNMRTNGTVPVYRTTLTLPIATETVISGLTLGGGALNYGLTDAKTTTGGMLTFYLPVGIATAAYNSDNYAADVAEADGNVFAVTIPETTPAATIDYVNEKLLWLTQSDTYTVNNAPKTANANGEWVIESGWLGTTINIVKKATDSTKADSAAQYLAVPSRPAAPSASALNPTTIGDTGGISDVNDTMEYGTDGTSWTSVTLSATSVSGLAAGTYHVRVKAGGSSFAGTNATVMITAFAGTQETTPNASIDFANEQLTGLTASALYTVNAAARTADGSGNLAIESGWLGTSISIVKKGNNTTTTDSVAQDLAVPTKATTPLAGAFTITQPSSIGGKGTIAGVTSAMEYSTNGGSAWNAGGSTISDITGGTTYLVRVKATGTVLASDNYSITITTFTSSDSGGTSPTPSKVVEVNGQKQDAGTSSTATSGGQTTTTIKVDDTKLDKLLEKSGEKPTVTLPSTGSDFVTGELNGQTVKNMEQKQATLEIKTGTVTYTLPASEINIDAVSLQLGLQVELKDIKVSVTIAEPSADTVKVALDTANKGNYQLVVKPVEFTITCTSGDNTVDVSRFNGYVERTVEIPDGIDPGRITTGIVLNSDGTVRHVPTRITIVAGKYYAVINSLTNSTYAVIYNPVEFADVSSHWAEDAINDMGSRLIVTGVGSSTYEPDRSITRAEFAAVVVSAMGIAQGSTESGFGDVTLSDWFNGYVDTATAYSLITGYDSTSFGPNDTITREQAMAIIARAMKITGLSVSLTDSEVSALLSTYIDGASVSSYAKESVAACLKSGIVTGTSVTTISPKAYVTRAEVAVMVQQLLHKSDLI